MRGYLKKPIIGLLLLSLILAAALGSPPPAEPQPLDLPPGDTLRLFSIGPLTLDPAISQEMTSHIYVLQIFSGLVSFDAEMNLVPDIAESWEISEDGRIYTFHLRRGVKFHDGREVKAQDFKYSWERAADPGTESLTAATYLGDIVGVKQKLAGETEEINGVEVIDDYTLKVTIDAPKAYFLAKLSYPVAFVVDQDNVSAGKEWWRSPNGTGPFKLKEWREDEFIVLERNELYYREKARVSHILFKLWSGVPMSMYEKGEIDITYVSIHDLERVTDPTSPLSPELMIAPELSVSYIGFNTAAPPFDDVKVRQAFSLAVDKEGIISQRLKGAVTLAEGILPRGLPGYNQELQGLGYDPEKARELIAESSYRSVANLPPLVFTVPGEGNTLSGTLRAIICQWKRNLGVEITVRQLESKAYYYRLKEEKDNLFDFGWMADYPDPQNFLEVLFHSAAENNIGKYYNPQVDALLEQAAVEQDEERRLSLYQQAEQLIIEDAAVLPLWFGQSYLLVKPYVKGFALSPLGIPLLSQVRLEPH
jgi:oligopeptide transport system substrate-binding protein